MKKMFPEITVSFLSKRYEIAEDTPLIELLVYMGEGVETERERKRNEMCQILNQKAVKYCLVDMAYYGFIRRNTRKV